MHSATGHAGGQLAFETLTCSLVLRSMNVSNRVGLMLRSFSFCLSVSPSSSVQAGFFEESEEVLLSSVEKATLSW